MERGRRHGGLALLESLSESGFDNVVAVRLPEATEALARGIAGVIGYEITAVCVIEPDAVVVLVVDTTDGAVQTAVNHAVTTDEDLARWLSAIFAQAEWRPEALVLVGSGSDLEAITPHLEERAGGAGVRACRGPVGTCPRCRHRVDARTRLLRRTGREDSGRVQTTPRRSSLFPRVGAAGAMLGIGVVTFVVSGSLAIGMQLTSGESAKPAENPPAASTSDAPAAVQATRPAPAATPTIEAALPPPPAEPPPPPVYDVEPVPVADPLAPEARAPDPLAPTDGSLPRVSSPPMACHCPRVSPTRRRGLVPAEVTPVPQRSGGILGRIRDRLSDLGKPDEPAQAPVDVVPPQDPLLVPPPADAPAPPPPG